MLTLQKGTALEDAVKAYLDAELRAMSHTASHADDDKPFLMSGAYRAGVRDKVHWMPEKCTWGLKFKGANVNHMSLAAAENCNTYREKQC